MRFRSVSLSAALLALFGLAVPATAQFVVVDNGPFSTSNSLDITGFAEADDFTLSAPATFNAIRFCALDNMGDPTLLDNFSGTLSWFVHTNGAGIPGSTILASGSLSSGITLTDTGANVNNYRVFRLDFSVPDTTLLPGTYWLRLKENAPNVPDDGSRVYWVQRNGQTGSISRGDADEVNPTTWNLQGFDLSYQLRFNAASAAIPEPGTLSLLLVGTLTTGAGVLHRGACAPRRRRG